MKDNNKEQHSQLEIIQAAAGEWSCDQVVQGEWPCDPNGFIIATTNDGSQMGQLYKVSLVTGANTNVGTVMPTSPSNLPPEQQGPNLYNALEPV